MKIGIYIEDIHIGGQQSYNFHLMKYYKSTDVKVFTIYHADGDFRPYFEDFSTLINLSPPPKNWVKALKNPFHLIKTVLLLRKAIKKHDLDIVLTNATYTYFIAAICKLITNFKLARILGCEPYREKLYWKYFNILNLHKVTDAIFGVESFLTTLNQRGVKKSILHDIGSLVDTSHFKPILDKLEIEKTKKDLSIPLDNIILGWPGRVDADTEIINSLKLIAKLVSLDFVTFRFIIFGDGSFMSEVRKFVKENGIEKYIIYMGWQVIKDMPKNIQLLDIIPLLRADVQGGSKLREAMAVGSIALTVDDTAGFQKTWIKHNNTGILVNHLNFIDNAALEIINLYKDPALMEKIRTQAINYANDFMSFEIGHKKLNAVFVNLLKK